MSGSVSNHDRAQRMLQIGFPEFGPFTYDSYGNVSLKGHPRKGQRAYRFKGSYHRHHFYVFSNDTVLFLNDEDDAALF